MLPLSWPPHWTLPPAGLRWISLALLLTGIGIAGWQTPALNPMAFVPPALPRSSPSEASANLNQLPASDALLGPASLTTLPDGRIAAAWLAGPETDPSAGAIWFSILGADGWQPARRAATRESTAAGTLAHLDRLGRPVLWAEGGWLHLWYESRLLGDGPGAVIHYTRSTDRGQDWSKARTLQSSALGTTGSGLGGAPLALADGGLLLPVERDFPGNGSDWLRLTATGRVVDKIRLPNTGNGGKASALALGDKAALLTLRGHKESERSQLYRTDDAGQSWQAEIEHDLPNPSSAVALIRLPSGKLLLAGNGANGSQSLHLWVSADEGHHWQLKRTLETAADGGAAFADPALAVAGDGRIHLVYTLRQRAIRHRSFSEAWLDGGAS